MYARDNVGAFPQGTRAVRRMLRQGHVAVTQLTAQHCLVQGFDVPATQVHTPAFSLTLPRVLQDGTGRVARHVAGVMALLARGMARQEVGPRVTCTMDVDSTDAWCL